jgi:hypothetical protein
LDSSGAEDPSDVRVELKVAGQEAAYDRLRMALEIQSEGIRRLYPPRQVQSVYLDSHFGRALEENLAGVSHREKRRFRWYGTESTEVVGKLELKVRENMLGWKRIVAVDRPMRVAGADRMGFVRALAAGVPLAWRDGLSGLEPAQWISYRREYLATADLAVRLTIDRQVRTWDQRPRLRLGDDPMSENRGPRIFILELKCAPAALHVAEGIVHRLPWAVGRCSKFVLASDPTHGPVPSLEPF